MGGEVGVGVCVCVCAFALPIFRGPSYDNTTNDTEDSTRSKDPNTHGSSQNIG